jgi:hypothetical protein
MEAQIAYEGDLSCMATISGGGAECGLLCHTGICNTDIGTSVIAGRIVIVMEQAHDFELEL